MKSRHQSPENSSPHRPRNTIGFNREQAPDLITVDPISERTAIARSKDNKKMNEVVLQVATIYFERRASKQYPDGAVKEFLEKMEKIYVKYYDDTV